ncbi:hypothetical protein B0H14DRAFT_2687837 [Mycena olivaceomarginata]|nr:hypothetical protein B0H14DRAFT_2687837 [Mycena olivaceomarginata]
MMESSRTGARPHGGAMTGMPLVDRPIQRTISQHVSAAVSSLVPHVSAWRSPRAVNLQGTNIEASVAALETNYPHVMQSLRMRTCRGGAVAGMPLVDGTNVEALVAALEINHPHIMQSSRTRPWHGEAMAGMPLINVSAADTNVETFITVLETKYPRITESLQTQAGRAEAIAAVSICAEQTFIEFTATSKALGPACFVALDAYVGSDLERDVKDEIARILPEDKKMFVSKLIEIIKTHRLRIGVKHTN